MEAKAAKANNTFINIMLLLYANMQLFIARKKLKPLIIAKVANTNDDIKFFLGTQAKIGQQGIYKKAASAGRRCNYE